MPPPNKTATISGKPVPKSANTTTSIAATIAPKKPSIFASLSWIQLLSTSCPQACDAAATTTSTAASAIDLRCTLYLLLFAERADGTHKPLCLTQSRMVCRAQHQACLDRQIRVSALTTP